MSVIDEIAAERQRQIESEGRTPERDDKHMDGVFGLSVRDKQNICWLFSAGWRVSWPGKWGKPKDLRRDLIRAGALIVAEIERMDRMALK